VISFIRQLFICVRCQWWPRWNFRVLSTALITALSFDETAGICAIPAAVDSGCGCGCAKPLRGECSYMYALFFKQNTQLSRTSASQGTSNCPFSVDISHTGIWNGSTVNAGLGRTGGYVAPLHGIHLNCWGCSNMLTIQTWSDLPFT
jgi:hypothetical protein